MTNETNEDLCNDYSIPGWIRITTVCGRVAFVQCSKLGSVGPDEDGTTMLFEAGDADDRYHATDMPLRDVLDAIFFAQGGQS